MSADTAADLLADLIGAAAWSSPTPAKAANSAKSEQARGPVPCFDPCEALRIAAKTEPAVSDDAPDSQTFAGIRKSQNAAQSELGRGLSQDSQDSQGVTGTKHSQSCAGCLHLLRHGTCGEPVAAGLAPHSGIRWAPEGYGATCPAFSARARSNVAFMPSLEGPGKATERPYKLTPSEGDACHAPSWDDAEIARFTARVQRFARQGIGADDADDLDERLTLRDRCADDRRLCLECTRHRPGRCGDHKGAGLLSAEIGGHFAVLLQRCPGFQPSR